MNSYSRPHPVVLARGFENQTDRDEFGVVFSDRPTGEIQSRLLSRQAWGALLQPLYGRTAEDLARQYCVLLGATEFGVFRVTPSPDRFHRRSVIIYGLIVDRGYSNDSRRAVNALSSLRDVQENVIQGAMSGSLEAVVSAVGGAVEMIDSHSHGPAPATFIDELFGTWAYSGAATPLLFGLGADVLVGTQREADQLMLTGQALAGFVDVRTGRIVSAHDAEDNPQLENSPAERHETTADPQLREILTGIKDELRRIRLTIIELAKPDNER